MLPLPPTGLRVLPLPPFAAGHEETEPKMNLHGMKKMATLPRMKKDAYTFQLVVTFFMSCPLYLTKALFSPVPRMAAEACTMAARMVKATVPLLSRRVRAGRC